MKQKKLSLPRKFWKFLKIHGFRETLRKTLVYVSIRYSGLYEAITGRVSIRRLLYRAYKEGGLKKTLKVGAAFIGFSLLFAFAYILGVRLSYYGGAGSPEQFVAWYKNHRRKVTIVIPTYKTIELVDRCLESIHKLPTGRDVRVIVVDDGSPQDIQEGLTKLEKKYSEVEFVLNKTNQGFAKTCNTGMEMANGDVILLNNDTEAKPGWLEALQFAAYSANDIGVVGSKLLYPNGLIQFGGGFRNFNAPEWFDHSYRMEPSNYGPANVAKDVLTVTGACMYIKRDVIKKVGILDPEFPMAFEDVDYCLRARAAGYRVRYCPESVLIHHESISRGKVQGERELKSTAHFWEKWGSWFDNRNVRDQNGNINVIYVLQDTGVAGGHRIVFDHLNRLKKLGGFNVKLFALAGPPEWFPLDVPVRTFGNYQQLSRALAKEEAIKVATWWETGDPVWQGSLQKGIPVFFVQDIESSYYKGDQRAQDTVIAYYRPEFNYFTTSGWNQDQLNDLHLHSYIVPCGLDTKLYRLKPSIKREDDVLLAVGRLHYLKNLDMTLRALKQMRRNFKFWLFGVEPEIEDKYPSIVDRYVYKPTDEGVVDLYNQATAFVQTSRHEGFCLPVLEAMAAGAAVVCTNADGNRDFCLHEKNCLIVAQDDHNDLSKSLERIFADKPLRDKLVAEGLKTAESYSWENVTKRLARYFTVLADNHSMVGGEVKVPD
ncbi:MAG: glycosyltransferase [Candidatus Berkelbacteria bacterium]|nr:glycosyltransferase [Candidatus Berkelbacteria bacterium]MCR4307499.1 glycosyltransferase [Candidatus Berkelbacteria bacterium]